jgi:hypothetical protein
MKSASVLFVLLAASAPIFGEEPAVIRLSEPVVVTEAYEVFGSPAEPGDARRLAEVIADDEQYLGKQVQVEARVAKVCQRKGCFFIAQDGDSVARVTFVDYSFFVPTDSGGKTVTIVGTFDRKTLSEDQARHYAEDAGGDPAAVRGPRSEYSIVATSVIVPRS